MRPRAKKLLSYSWGWCSTLPISTNILLMCHTKIFNSQHEPSCKFQLPICHYSIVLVIIIIVYYCKKCQQKHHPISLKFNSKRPKLYHSFLHSDDLMALKGFLINTGGGFPQLDWGQLNFKHLGSVYKVRVGSVSVSSDENPSNSTADLQKSVDKRESSVTKKVQKGLSFLPSKKFFIQMVYWYDLFSSMDYFVFTNDKKIMILY